MLSLPSHSIGCPLYLSVWLTEIMSHSTLFVSEEYSISLAEVEN